MSGEAKQTGPLSSGALILLPILMGALYLANHSWSSPTSQRIDSVSAQDLPIEGTVENVVTRFLERHEVPGVSLCLVRTGEVAVVGGFGQADLTSGRPVTEHTLFHLASVSKTFVAVGILALVEQGALSLDEPVASALTYFELGDPRGALITPRQLLSHTSGLPDVRDYRWDDPEWDDGALERYVRSLATQKLRSDPGAFFAYSNMGYEVLGAVLAAAAESSFESFMETRVLQPLGMVSSTFEFPMDRPERLASPHIGRNPVRVSPTYPYNRAHSPSSTLHSSAFDMCHWIKEHVRTGDSTGHRILDERTYDEMWSPQAEIRPGLSQSLGWAQAHSHLGRWISHEGRDIGFRASLTLLPDRRGGLALLSNHNSAPLGELRDELITLAFDESGRSHPGQP